MLNLGYYTCVDHTLRVSSKFYNTWTRYGGFSSVISEGSRVLQVGKGKRQFEKGWWQGGSSETR